MIDQADTRRDHVYRNVHPADHVLIAGLVVVALVIDGANDVDPALADQTSGTVAG